MKRHLPDRRRSELVGRFVLVQISKADNSRWARAIPAYPRSVPEFARDQLARAKSAPDPFHDTELDRLGLVCSSPGYGDDKESVVNKSLHDSMQRGPQFWTCSHRHDRLVTLRARPHPGLVSPSRGASDPRRGVSITGITDWERSYHVLPPRTRARFRVPARDASLGSMMPTRGFDLMVQVCLLKPCNGVNLWGRARR